RWSICSRSLSAAASCFSMYSSSRSRSACRRVSSFLSSARFQKSWRSFSSSTCREAPRRSLRLTRRSERSMQRGREPGQRAAMGARARRRVVLVRDRQGRTAARRPVAAKQRGGRQRRRARRARADLERELRAEVGERTKYTTTLTLTYLCDDNGAQVADPDL